MNNILVGNLGPDVTKDDIRSTFEKHGAVQGSKLMIDRWTGLSRGFGFIQMKHDEEAEKAIFRSQRDGTQGQGLEGKCRPTATAQWKSKT